MTIFNMSTTIRHFDLVEAFSARGFYMKYNDKMSIKTYASDISLVHNGHRLKDPYYLSLIDIDTLKDINTIDHLSYVQPDFMMFHNNKFLINENQTRIAGCPDLVLEIWSDSDSVADRDVKFSIYAQSKGRTEHWYIVQDSNIVECYIGESKLKDQTLKRPLRTKNGIEFDLTHLAL